MADLTYTFPKNFFYLELPKKKSYVLLPFKDNLFVIIGTAPFQNKIFSDVVMLLTYCS